MGWAILFGYIWWSCWKMLHALLCEPRHYLLFCQNWQLLLSYDLLDWKIIIALNSVILTNLHKQLFVSYGQVREVSTTESRQDTFTFPINHCFHFAFHHEPAKPKTGIWNYIWMTRLKNALTNIMPENVQRKLEIMNTYNPTSSSLCAVQDKLNYWPITC